MNTSQPKTLFSSSSARACGVLLLTSVAFGAIPAFGDVIDFEGFPAGTEITTQYPEATIAAYRKETTGYVLGEAWIFDSTTAGSGPDPDLATPSTTGLGNISTASLGNLLIIQDPGFSEPNDYAGGGAFLFDFSAPITSFGFDVVDVEPAEVASSMVWLLNDAGIDLSLTFSDLIGIDPTLEFGDNSINRIAPLAAAPGVSWNSAVVFLGGSGAIDNVNFTFEGSEVPEPGEIALVVLGALGLAREYRRRKAAAAEQA